MRDSWPVMLCDTSPAVSVVLLCLFASQGKFVKKLFWVIELNDFEAVILKGDLPSKWVTVTSCHVKALVFSFPLWETSHRTGAHQFSSATSHLCLLSAGCQRAEADLFWQTATWPPAHKGSFQTGMEEKLSVQTAVLTHVAVVWSVHVFKKVPC